MPSATVSPNGGATSSDSAMGSLLSNVDMSGGPNRDEETKKKLRALGIPGFKKGGKVSSASKRADGIAIRGKTRA